MEEIRLVEEQKRIARARRAVKKGIVKAKRKSISEELKTEVPEDIRVVVEKKYNTKCAICKRRPGNMQIHHINLKNEDNRLENLEILCQKHHLEKHNSKI